MINDNLLEGIYKRCTKKRGGFFLKKNLSGSDNEMSQL